jgi:hypothetical protein
MLHLSWRQSSVQMLLFHDQLQYIFLLQPHRMVVRTEIAVPRLSSQDERRFRSCSR